MQQVPAVADQTPAIEAASPTGRRRRSWYVVLSLCFFAAVIPETIATTSTSVAKIVAQPWGLIFLMLFYGLADLLIREAMIRRRLGWFSLVLFGIAFSCMNEGVIAGTWYPGKNADATYIGQISFAVAAGLTVFHLFISVITPIAFIDTLFPSRARMPLLHRRGIVISASVFLLLMVLSGFAPTYRSYRLAVLALALTLAIVALRLPAARPRVLTPDPSPRLRRLWWIGFLGSLTLYGMILVVPAIIQKIGGKQVFAAQAATVAVLALYAALLLRIGRRWTGRLRWSPRHTLALISGVLAFPALVFTLVPQLWKTLEFFVTIPFLALLFWLHHRLRKRETIQSSMQT